MKKGSTGQLSMSFILDFSVSLFIGHFLAVAQNDSLNTRSMLDIGIILDMTNPMGNMSASYISMALSDLDTNPKYTMGLNPHWRDSNGDIIDAASMAIELIEYVQVKAIIGPQTSAQAQFVAEVANKAQVPMLSFSATSPLLSSVLTPYFIRTAPSDTSQVQAIAAIIQYFGWKQVVLVYEDTPYGALPNFTDALQDVEVSVPNKGAIPYMATDDQIHQELSRLKAMQIRTFVVHLSPSLGSRLFLEANRVGMMSKGYAWIITDSLANLLDSMNSSVIQSMQGILGVRPYFPQSQELENFLERWKSNFPNTDTTDELLIYGLWAYDTVWALAKAVEGVETGNSPLLKQQTKKNSTDLDRLGVSEMGPGLREAILKTNFTGLSGEFSLTDGQLEWPAFQIVNVIGKGKREIGFWTRSQGIQMQLSSSKKYYSASIDHLKAVIWPGETVIVPKGWEINASERILKIAVPKKVGFTELLNVTYDSRRNQWMFEGYSIDVFAAAVRRLPEAIPYEFVPVADNDGNGNYSHLISQVYLKKFDALVGDVSISASRSAYVDFTAAYTGSGFTMVVLAHQTTSPENAWIFLKPLRWDLWLTIGAAFICTGVVVWSLEHRINEEFRGPIAQQVGVILWFSFSTLVFAHRERVVSNWSRLVVIVWVFVVWIVTTSYTASFSSMLTVQQLQPSIKDIGDLIKNKEYVGYQSGSMVADILRTLNIDNSMLKAYSTPEEYAEALFKGSKNGGVGAIFDEMPYLTIFLAKKGNCDKFKMVGPVYRTDGFAFAFPKGSPLVPQISSAIFKIREEREMDLIDKKWMVADDTCSEESASVPSNSLTLGSFWGLFLLTGAISVSALLFFLLSFLYKERDLFVSHGSNISFHKILIAIINRFFKRDLSHHTLRMARPNEGLEMGIGHAENNAPLADASVEPSVLIPKREAPVAIVDVENGPRPPARMRWRLLYRAWRFRSQYNHLRVL